MGNIITERLNAPSKQPTSQSRVGIDAIVKALNKITLQETVLMLTFAKLIDNLNQNLLNYSKSSADASDAAAVSTKWDDRINQFLGFTGAMGGLSLFVFENPETAGPIRQKLSGQAMLFSNYPAHIMIATQMIAELVKINFAMSKGKLTSETMEIQASSKKCEMLINILKERFDSDTDTLKTISNTQKDILEKDYNSKAKKLYFYNKK